jgi:hypothetical protein
MRKRYIAVGFDKFNNLIVGEGADDEEAEEDLYEKNEEYASMIYLVKLKLSKHGKLQITISDYTD